MASINLILELRSYGSEAHTHQHDYHQLVLPVSGALEMSVGNSAGVAHENRAAVIAAGEDHGFAASSSNAFVVADISERLAPELAKLPAFITLDPVIAHYVSFLHSQLSQDKNRSQSSERQMLLLLIQLLKERYGETLAIDKRIETARIYLDQHFEQPVSLALLSTIAHLSRRQLSELFKQEIGMTPHQYLTEKRMQQAWKLLEAQQLSIQEVADQVGYNNLSAFSDRFKKYFGYSPRHFRSISK
ncbi:AraC family transcriptional regulator [Neptunomonas concharum]|uniref:Helix-turn-helix transcriptional regulator n=1 Tax=Neptunomonas concharum TaxID=1031538 RepID=A0A5P1REU7_9GAMM|nr:AraC family transcriptional regulator [Neptunomonas concharum]QEQ97785.1 helix-turn-helix transcriptional regulator [Neptunomonas concharum]